MGKECNSADLQQVADEKNVHLTSKDTGQARKRSNENPEIWGVQPHRLSGNAT